MRFLPSAIAASVLLLSLTACNPFTDPYEDIQRDGGVTPAQAEEALLEIDGISAAEYGTYDWYSPGEGGMFSSSGMDIVLNVTVDPEYSIDDHEAFFEYLAATAWSVNDHYPKGSVVIQLTGGADLNFDWLAVVRAVMSDDFNGFSSPQSQDPYDDDAEWMDDGRTISVIADNYGKRFGRWPSEPVDAPAGMLAHEPVEQMLLPAITDLELTATVNGDGEACYSLRFTRSGQGVTYGGEVTVTVYGASGTELASEEVNSGGSYAYLCVSDGVDEGATAEVVSGEYEDYAFQPVTETVTLTDD